MRARFTHICEIVYKRSHMHGRIASHSTHVADCVGCPPRFASRLKEPALNPLCLRQTSPDLCEETVNGEPIDLILQTLAQLLHIRNTTMFLVCRLHGDDVVVSWFATRHANTIQLLVQGLQPNVPGAGIRSKQYRIPAIDNRGSVIIGLFLEGAADLRSRTCSSLGCDVPALPRRLGGLVWVHHHHQSITHALEEAIELVRGHQVDAGYIKYGCVLQGIRGFPIKHRGSRGIQKRGFELRQGADLPESGRKVLHQWQRLVDEIP
mmetsp:Transcript_71660/g.180996  ORF Transcript_71660/g.180996 Transcript_71660/m.180996 type:complete len:264 (-) Transcript_71660:517-1308(-)